MNKDTRIVKIKNTNGDFDKSELEEIARAAAIIKNGGLVAFPTETVYGLGGNALNPDASMNIYKAKGRPSDNPLIVHIADKNDVKNLVSVIPETAKVLMDKLWPGPLTIIFPKSEIVPFETTGKLDTVAIRFPENKIAQKLIELSKVPIAAPSANTSGRPSPTNAEHVSEDLFGKIDMIIDGGSSVIGLESTVLDLTGEKPLILRPGGISLEDIKKYLHNVEFDPAVLKKVDEKNQAFIPKAPGMKYKHYAPKAQITIVETDEYKKSDDKTYYEFITSKICNMIADDINNKLNVGVIATIQTLDYYVKHFNMYLVEENGLKRYYNNEKNITLFIIGDINIKDSIAANLFKVLRAFDHENVQKIYSEGVDKEDIGMAIRNRLYKAAGYNVFKVD